MVAQTSERQPVRDEVHRMDPPAYWLDEDLSTIEKVHAFDQVPLLDRGLPSSVYALLMRSCAVSPDSTAIRYVPDALECDKHNAVYTYAQVGKRVHQTANLIRSLDVDPDETVSFLPANVPESLFTLWGAQTAAIANPINGMLEPAAIAQILKSAKSKVLFAYGGNGSADSWRKVLEVVELCGSQIKRVVRFGGDRSGAAPRNVHFMDYEDVIDSFAGDRLDFEREILPYDTAAVYPTGGTTGVPKLAKHTHFNEVASAWISALVSGIQQGETRLSASPLFHVMAPISGCLATVARGGTLVLATADGWRNPHLVDNLWSIVRTFGVSYFTLVPTVANQLIHRPVDRDDLVSLKGVFSGSAALSEHVSNEFKRMTGISIREGYGMTETTSVLALNPRGGQVKIGTTGLPFPYHRTRVVSPDLGSGVVDVPAGEAGLLLVAGPAIIPGYLDRQLDDGLWVEGTWLNTGDLARIDGDGYLTITGRAKDLIIRGGHNIDPRTVEELFHAHPEVLEAGVVGRPDRHAGEVPVAYVQLRPGATTTAEELLEFAKAHVAERASLPKDCYVLGVLPKSAVGKIMKNALRLDATQRAFTAALRDAGLLSHCVLVASDNGASGISCVVTVDDPVRYEAEIQAALAGFSTRFEITAGVAS